MGPYRCRTHTNKPDYGRIIRACLALYEKFNMATQGIIIAMTKAIAIYVYMEREREIERGRERYRERERKRERET